MLPHADFAIYDGVERMRIYPNGITTNDRALSAIEAVNLHISWQNDHYKEYCLFISTIFSRVRPFRMENYMNVLGCGHVCVNYPRKCCQCRRAGLCFLCELREASGG